MTLLGGVIAKVSKAKDKLCIFTSLLDLGENAFAGCNNISTVYILESWEITSLPLPGISKPFTTAEGTLVKKEIGFQSITANGESNITTTTELTLQFSDGIQMP